MVRFFVHPIFASGHYQTATTLGQELMRRGHQVIIYAPELFENRMRSNRANEGFQYWHPKVEPDNFEDLLEQVGHFRMNDFDSHQEFNVKPYERILNEHRRFEKEIDQIIDELKPDVIITDQVVSIPKYIAKKLPWIQIISMNILSYCDVRLPPRELGLPFKTGDTVLWDKYRAKEMQLLKAAFAKLDEYYEEFGIERKRKHSTFEESDFLNVYCRPRELDYFDDPNEWGANFVRFETLIRTEQPNDDFGLDLAKLSGLPGRLILLSLGTMASSRLYIMKSVLEKISQIRHRFIVSLGVAGDELQLPANCVGANFLPQTCILQMVDVFVSHGGNNSFLEGLHYGVPMVVMPVFMDQLDNARRLEEEDLGKRLCLLDFTSNQLQSAIDDLLSNTKRIDRIKSIGRRLQQSESVKEAIDLIERKLTEIGIKTSNDENAVIN